MPASWDGLADALNSAPDLHGAACAGQWDLFDPPDTDTKEHPADTRRRHEIAKVICNTCSIYDDCFAWATTLLPGEVSGVLAGAARKPPARSLPPYQRRDSA